jgi:hypothetical protein
MRNSPALPVLLLLPAAAAACPGGYGSSSPDTVLLGVDRVWIHLRTIVPVLLTVWSLRRWPSPQGHVDRARPTFLVLTILLWSVLIACGISTKPGFLGPGTAGYGSFPLAAEAALLLAAPLLVWSGLRSLWSRLRDADEPRPPRTPKKSLRDTGGREEPGGPTLIGLLSQGLMGIPLTLGGWVVLIFLLSLLCGQPFFLVSLLLALLGLA